MTRLLLQCTICWGLGVLAALAGCGGDDVDVNGLPSTAGYQSWQSRTVQGEVPGHGDTIRVIYVNEVGRSYAHDGRYPVGTVLVKEVYEKNGSSRGSLKETDVMRKVAEDFLPSKQPLDRGWLFTSVDGGKEKRKASCFDACHRQAKFDYAWFDYGD